MTNKSSCRIDSIAAHGTKKMDMRVLEQWPLPLLPLPLQQKITAILSAYDDLIENNKRRIALLEKMTEEIYREWFVRMRFPGYEKAEFKKGVPENWQIVQLNEISKINALSLKNEKGPEFINYVDIGSVTTNRINEIRKIHFSKTPGRARRVVKHGDIIWSSVRPANRAFCLIYEPIENLIVSTGFTVITSNKDIPQTFTYFAVTSDSFIDYITMVAKGAAYPATSFDDFAESKILLPTTELLKDFHELCEPIFRQINQHSKINVSLIKTRDMLLGRLILGKLPVESLNIQFPPSMQTEQEAAYA